MEHPTQINKYIVNSDTPLSLKGLLAFKWNIFPSSHPTNNYDYIYQRDFKQLHGITLLRQIYQRIVNQLKL